jgi:hypothetical protein
VEVQNKTLTLAEIDAYCDIISNLDCPVCNSNEGRLNATMTGEVISMIIASHYRKRLKIACAACLDKACNEALAKTLLLGWWEVPTGFFHTIQAIIFNLKNKRTNRLDTHSDYLRNFALNAVGQLETYKGNKKELRALLILQNSSQD